MTGRSVILPPLTEGPEENQPRALPEHNGVDDMTCKHSEENNIDFKSLRLGVHFSGVHLYTVELLYLFSVITIK